MGKIRSRESGDEIKEIEEEVGRGDFMGEELSRGLGEMVFGFGGLRFEGIVGMLKDFDGEGDVLFEFGVGNRGDIFGDIVFRGEVEKFEGVLGKNVGVVDDMVES